MANERFERSLSRSDFACSELTAALIHCPGVDGDTIQCHSHRAQFAGNVGDRSCNDGLRRNFDSLTLILGFRGGSLCPDATTAVAFSRADAVVVGAAGRRDRPTDRGPVYNNMIICTTQLPAAILCVTRRDAF